MEDETEPVLSLTGLSKSFPGVRALHDVTFGLKAGEVTALIGENGAGKSTIVKILTGIYAPDDGKIFVRGKMLQLRLSTRLLGRRRRRHSPGNRDVR